MTQLPIVSTDPTPAPTSGGCGCGGCGGDSAAAAEPQVDVQPGDLDVRTLAHGERRERILGAVAALLPGEALVLAVDHDPQRLRVLLDEKEPGQVEWTYLAEGPELWRVRLQRVAAHCC